MAANNNANIIEDDGQQLLPSWDKVVALAIVYKCLLFSVVIVPVVMVATPIMWNMAYPICDRLTNNHTILTFMLTYCSTRFIQNKIRNAAPSPKDAVEALNATEIWLPLIMFVVFATIANYIWLPVGEMLGINAILSFSPVMSISFAFHLACGALLLGFAVVLRYIGPFSIVRCSSSPLLAHPMITRIRKFVSDLSVDAVYDFAVLDHHREDARRLQCPTFFDAILQLVSSGLLALAFTCVSVLPYFSSSTEEMDNVIGGDDNDNNSNKNLSLILSCIFAVWANLYRTGLDGSSHELNPVRYHASQWKKRHNIIMKIKSICKSLFYAAVIIPLIAYFVPLILLSYYDKVGNDETMWPVLLSCAIPAMLVTVYLDIFDDVLRTQLCTPISNIQKAVEQIADDNRVAIFLDVIMHSVLHSQSDLVEKVVQSVQPLLNHLERKELQRNESAMEAMAKILLGKSSSGDEGSARLEEDILRLWVLESLGGTSSSIENIRSWIQPKNNELNTGQTLVEPLSVPLVRALCAYVGGLGEALVVCGGQKVPPNVYPWNIPPGSIVCAEYGLRGASRCILFNLSHSPQILSDWRSTHLSMLIPVLIVSAYRLQQGIVKFTQARNGIKDITTSEKFDFVRTESPELLSLFNECNDSVAAVLQKLLSLDGVSRIDFDLEDPVIRKWMEGILAKSKSM